MKELSTIEEVITALGGIKATADLCGRGYTTAANWKYRGFFPSNTYFLMLTELSRNNFSAPITLWIKQL